MDPRRNVFGRGPRELTGTQDLINRYKLLPHHEFFCKRSRPVSVLDTHYLNNVVGDTEIRKGEGMQLDQLVQNTSSKDNSVCIQPFNLDVLGEAFRLRETAKIDLPPSEKGFPSVAVKSERVHKDKDKHKKKDKDRHKDKEQRKHKHKDRSKGKEKEKEIKKDKDSQHESGAERSKKKSRPEDGNTNGIPKHKKSRV